MNITKSKSYNVVFVTRFGVKLWSILNSIIKRKFVSHGLKDLKIFIGSIFDDEKVTLHTLNYVFCTDQYLLEINKEFLQHDDYTDIITFNLSNSKTLVDGEIYISVDRVADNCQKLKVVFSDELMRVIIHGVLHLCGYRDKTKSEILEMRNKEEHYLRSYRKRT